MIFVITIIPYLSLIIAWGNLGNILSQQGKLSQAEQAYRTALKVRPNMADAHYNL